MKRTIALTGLILSAAACVDSHRAEPTESTDTARQAALIDPSFWKAVDKLTSTASTASKYFSGAKTAIDIATQLGALLGLWSEDSAAADFAALTTVVQDDARAVDWDVISSFIDTNRSMATTAVGRVKRNGVVADIDDSQSSGAANALSTSLVPYYRINDPSVTAGDWQNIIPDRAVPTSDSTLGPNMVYDWRLGVPALMEVISDRLAIIAAEDANFLWDGKFSDDLRAYSQALESHYDAMVAGIRCGSLAATHACADINTGISVSATSPSGGAAPSPEVMRARLAEQLKLQMPLFALRSMIDAINLYLSGANDLTEAYGQIPLATAPNLCLDAPGGGVMVPLQVTPCNRGSTQTWTYDRMTSTITSASGWCLDVHNGDVIQQNGSLVPVSANPVTWPVAWTYWCNGTAAQQWTYDPASLLLRNALGTTLDVQWGDLAVQTRQATGGGSQLWRADQPFQPQPTPPAGCGRLNPGEALTVESDVSSCNGNFVLTLEWNGDVDLVESIPYSPTPPPPAPARYTVQRWDTASSGSVGDILAMQGDGNLVLYNGTGGAVWSSNTWGHPGAYLAIPDTGGLVIVDTDGSQLWATTAQSNYKQHRAPPSVLWYDPTTGEVSAWALDASGNVTGHRTLSGSCDAASGCSQAWSAVGTGDFNGDGVVDVLWKHESGWFAVWVLATDGTVTGSFGLSRPTCANCNARPVALLDLDGNGVTDLLWFDSGSGVVSAWLLDDAGNVIGDRSLSWVCGQSGACSSFWRPVGAMDVNDDGRKDLLWQNTSTGEVAGWLLDGDVTGAVDLSWRCARGGCSESWTIVGSGDFNGDATDDLLWYGESVGDVSAWLTDGNAGVFGSQLLSIGCEATPINAPLTTLSGCAQAWHFVGVVNVR
jgi:hypothetical protein